MLTSVILFLHVVKCPYGWVYRQMFVVAGLKFAAHSLRIEQFRNLLADVN